MIGKRKTQRELFDVGNVYPLALDPSSFHGQLAAAAPRLFQDADFAVFYSTHTGRPSVPPAQLALLTLLQHEAGVSDAEAVARSGFDLRWAAVLGRAAGTPLCAKSTLQLFRAHLILHDEVRSIFQRSIQEAKDAGLLKSGPLRVAIDTKPLLGRGAVEDTYNLLATGIRGLCKALAQVKGQKPEDWARKHDLRRYFATSLKGSADLDWSDPAARQAFLAEIVTDARRLLRLTAALWPHLPTASQPAVRTARELLEQLLLQDVEETTGPDGRVQAKIKEGTVPGRVPSATDPEVRHGRKSKSQRFNGHKTTVAVDKPSQILLDADVLAGDAPDATGLKAQVERVEENTGEAVAETSGDCAYGSGETRQEFAEAGRVLHAKVPQEGTNGGLFPKSAFVLLWKGECVTSVRCPGGQTPEQFTVFGESGRIFQFGAACAGCPLRAQCTTAAGGRSVRVHPQEALLREARAFQASAAGREVLRERVVVEHRLARLGQLGLRQARYVGRQKTRFQVLIAATVANLRWTWNWQQRQTPGTAGGGSPAPEERRRGRGPEREPGREWERVGQRAWALWAGWLRGWGGGLRPQRCVVRAA